MADSSHIDPSEQSLPVNFDQEYRVKLGRTFTFPKENAFHTIKYDFKPKSVDSSQPGRMKVSGDEVSVSLPVTQAESANDVVLFKGAKRTCTKECVLIINTVTGEAILEKISNTVQLKGVRDPRKKKQPRSVSPLLPSVQPKPSKPTVAMETAPSSSSLTKQSVNKKTKRPKKNDKTPPNSNNNKSKTSSSLLTLPDSLSPMRSNNPTPEPPTNIEPPPPPPIYIPPPSLPPPPSKKKKQSSSSASSSSDSSSSSSSSDSENEFTSVTTTTTGSNNNFIPHSLHNQSMLSMPQFTSIHQQQSVTMTKPSVHVPVGQPSNDIPTGSTGTAAHHIGTLSDASSSSSSSDGEESSSSSDSPQNAISFQPQVPVNEIRQRSMSVLKKDLEMSDSDSD